MTTNDIMMRILLGVVVLVTILALAQQPFNFTVALGAVGFLLLTVGWVTMYFRLRRDLPEHALVGATYFAMFRRSRAVSNMFRLIAFHFERHGLDLRSFALVAGVVLLAAAAMRELTR